jgi:hypothetical protein
MMQSQHPGSLPQFKTTIRCIEHAFFTVRKALEDGLTGQNM